MQRKIKKSPIPTVKDRVLPKKLHYLFQDKNQSHQVESLVPELSPDSDGRAKILSPAQESMHRLIQMLHEQPSKRSGLVRRAAEENRQSPEFLSSSDIPLNQQHAILRSGKDPKLPESRVLHQTTPFQTTDVKLLNTRFENVNNSKWKKDHPSHQMFFRVTNYEDALHKNSKGPNIHKLETTSDPAKEKSPVSVDQQKDMEQKREFLKVIKISVPSRRDDAGRHDRTLRSNKSKNGDSRESDLKLPQIATKKIPQVPAEEMDAHSTRGEIHRKINRHIDRYREKYANESKTSIRTQIHQPSPPKAPPEIKLDQIASIVDKDHSLQLLPEDLGFGPLNGMDTKRYDYSIDFEDYAI